MLESESITNLKTKVIGHVWQIANSISEGSRTEAYSPSKGSVPQPLVYQKLKYFKLSLILYNFFLAEHNESNLLQTTPLYEKIKW